MKFKGDIIITDPCYIIKDNSDDWDKCGWGDINFFTSQVGI